MPTVATTEAQRLKRTMSGHAYANEPERHRPAARSRRSIYRHGAGTVAACGAESKTVPTGCPSM
jgi:hypothetical protein